MSCYTRHFKGLFHKLVVYIKCDHPFIWYTSKMFTCVAVKTGKPARAHA